MQATNQIMTQVAEGNGRGGAGRGQGRHPLNDQNKTVRITITLTEDDLAFLDTIKHGGTQTVDQNRSAGVRWALRAFRREQKALLAEAHRIKAEIETDPLLIVTEEELERDIAAKVAAMTQQAKLADHVEN